jgi:ABC-2 type transport system ATP-binding protein
LKIIDTESLTKIYKGKDKPAIDSLDLQIENGELFGFLGPNGAGKSTTIRILMTLLRPSSGRAHVRGYDVQTKPLEAMKQVGFVPENPGFYHDLTGRQHLSYWAELHGLDGSALAAQIEKLLERVGLFEARDKLAKDYSLGMKRRLALAGALLPDPQLLILDEPSLGLDPQGMAFVRSLLVELHKEGRTIFLSSHLLGEVERLCTKVGLLSKGKLIRVDTPRAISQSVSAAGELEIETKGAGLTIVEILRKIDGVSRVELDGTVLRISGALTEELSAEINRVLIVNGVSIISSRRQEHGLEDAFLALTKGEV